MVTQNTKHWGTAITIKTHASGIVEYITASHGGFEISEDRMKQMPEEYRACSFTKDNCFEEDCSWCAVVLAFPLYFSAKMIWAARQTYNGHYLKKTA